MVQRRPDRKRLRRQMAEEMAAERAQRSTEHQWDQLDQRLGKDHGACSPVHPPDPR
jgi:hypothetical protein